MSLRVDADAGTAAGGVSVPWTALVSPEGAPRPAHEAWTLLRKAGLPRLFLVDQDGNVLHEGPVPAAAKEILDAVMKVGG